MVTSPSRARRSAARRGCHGCSALSAELKQVSAERDGLAGEVERLKTEKVALTAKLEDARRAAKRQAAPFSKGGRMPDTERKRPGRRAGASYGRKGHRLPPEAPDEEIEVPLPDACPDCGGDLNVERWAEQFQDELVTAVVRRKFVVAMGRCPDCDRVVRGRHPEQTSEALGAAGSMLGPRALALAAWLRYGTGMPAAKISKLFAELGLAVSAGGITGALGRLAGDAEGTYGALIAALRASLVISPDETGWRVDAERGWLWAFVGDHVTVYDIAIGRGFDEAAAVMGADYDGVICRDGWAPYRRFTNATHQTCLAHLLRRANEMIADSVAGQARIPHAVRRLLGDALALRARRDAAQVGGDALEAAITTLEARADKLLTARVSYEPNRRLLAHLAKERPALFTFLRHPGVPATNHEAERAIRPQVCARKNWGGNKSWDGAHAAAVIGSVTRTAVQQGHNPIDVLARIASTDGASCGLDLPECHGP